MNWASTCHTAQKWDTLERERNPHIGLEREEYVSAYVYVSTHIRDIYVVESNHTCLCVNTLVWVMYVIGCIHTCVLVYTHYKAQQQLCLFTHILVNEQMYVLVSKQNTWHQSMCYFAHVFVH